MKAIFMSAPNTNNPQQIVIEAFTTATITTLQELIGKETYFEQCQLNREAEANEPIVVAVIDLLRENPGYMFLVLSPDTASQLAARYLPAGSTLTTEIIDDVAGEFANVIAGQAKTILKGTTHHFQISTPLVNRAKVLELSLANSMLLTLLAPDLGQIRLAIKPPSGAEITSRQ